MQTNFDAVHNSERGIVFRFGIYLDKLKLPVLHEYDIDVEYDRNIARNVFLVGKMDVIRILLFISGVLIQIIY
jgi:regulator of protease activity HflC (stomatin/prohibitin superfamily)